MHCSVEQLQQELSVGEGFLVTSSANRRYLTGFSSSAGVVLITKEQRYFLTDFRYFEKAAKEVASFQVKMLTGLSADVLPLLKNNGVHTLFVETESVSLATLSRWKSVFEGINLAKEDRLDRLLGRLRSIKTPQEIANIKAAQALTDQTFSYILQKIVPGRSEVELMLDMEFFIRQQGSEGVAFDFIVVSGNNTSLPHGVPTNRIIQKGDLITMDFGGVVKGYRSDMTRTVAVGEPTNEQKKVYNTVLTAKNSAIASIRPHMVCKEVDKIARDFIDHAGYPGCFGHGLGHSVGIEIHEDPSFNTRCETRLAPGMVITVEPGIYLENQFGVRIEDMIVVTENGCENLTHSPDQLIIV